MKKVLFTTTALVASASIAAAEVSISGSAEMGIYDDGGPAGAQYYQSSDINFAMSGESNNGISFGATVDLDEAPMAAYPDGHAGTAVWIEYNGLKASLGNVDGAFDAAMKEVALAGGSIADDETSHSGYDGNDGFDGDNDGQILQLAYSFDSFTGYLSYEQGDIAGVGVNYDADLGGVGLNVGLGYQQNSTDDIWGISLATTFNNGIMAAVNYSDDSSSGYHAAIGFGYQAGDLAMGINYGKYQGGADGFGLAASYDLGGGLAAKFGYAANDTTADTWSLGLGMSF